ncbi:restriction endonuclease subunit S [Bacteroides acidifaciens]|uniref:methylation-associated defense system restriction endonuclease subunit S MAD5 n=1 Tax=Bacteroides acidifaciens TaxID=85831 RepID=UPI002575C939|nr:restriction endonuclease subunit S [Bacteroides acidifaciens]
MKTGKVKFSELQEVRTRLDGSYHLSEAQLVKSYLAKSPFPLVPLKDVSKRIWHAGRWKRVYVDNSNTGITLLGSSAMLKGDLTHEKLVSKKYTDDISDKILQAGWILISCSGTIGNCAFTNAQHAGKLASQHVIRLLPNNILGSGLKAGVIYAYLASKYGYVLLTQGTSSSVIQHIEPENVETILIPQFPTSFQKEVDDLIQESARLREEAADELALAEKTLKEKAGLRDLTPDDYDYFGQHSASRRPSCFIRKASEVGAVSFNAFNHSERIRNTLSELDSIPTIKIKDAISNEGWVSPGGVNVVELKPGNGVMLINQSDIFDTIVKGKWVPKKDKYSADLLKYGEILIAKIGTLGENETFCRTIFVNEDLCGQLVSSAFYRISTSFQVPTGYLYCWLNSDWGFRQLRSSQFGTKLCYPNIEIMNEYKIPTLLQVDMDEIDRLVKTAHTKRHEANVKELKAISMVESEIEKWKL